jgi:hypothetical protein
MLESDIDSEKFSDINQGRGLLDNRFSGHVEKSFWPRVHIIALYFSNALLLFMLLEILLNDGICPKRDPSLGVWCECDL